MFIIYKYPYYDIFKVMKYFLSKYCYIAYQFFMHKYKFKETRGASDKHDLTHPVRADS